MASFLIRPVYRYPTPMLMKIFVTVWSGCVLAQQFARGAACLFSIRAARVPGRASGSQVPEDRQWMAGGSHRYSS